MILGDRRHLSEMAIAILLYRDRSAVRIGEPDAHAGFDSPDPRDRNIEPGGERNDALRGIGRRRKQQFVIVSACREARADNGVTCRDDLSRW